VTVFLLRQEITNKLTVLIFYRGGWCPFCNLHRVDVQKALEELAQLGYHVLAISPDEPVELSATAEKNQLTYKLLSENDLETIDAFGLGLTLDDATVAKYRKYGIKLRLKRDEKIVLPVPAVYLVDQTGKVAFVHYDPDYKQRLSSAELLKAAHEAAGK